VFATIKHAALQECCRYLHNSTIAISGQCRFESPACHGPYFDVFRWIRVLPEEPFVFPPLQTQDPITTLQGHVSYTIRRQMWFAVDGTLYQGGAGYVNGGPSSISQSNPRFGATLSLPLSKRQSLEVAYSGGATAPTESSFDTIGVAWRFVWFGISRPTRKRKSRPRTK
jgi:hypothetical protein